jgi:hypothetical protein
MMMMNAMSLTHLRGGVSYAGTRRFPENDPNFEGSSEPLMGKAMKRARHFLFSATTLSLVTLQMGPSKEIHKHPWQASRAVMRNQ